MKLLTLFLLVHQFLDDAHGDGRIYGGYSIDITDAPYMVHVQYIKEYLPNNRAVFSNCGGTILRKNLILTAGHCKTKYLFIIKNKNEPRFFQSGTKNLTSGAIRKSDRYIIRVGSSLKSSGGKIHKVSRVFVHPKFVGGSNNYHHDVGLLQLSKDIYYDDSASYTTLVHSNDVINPGTDGVVSGWGELTKHKTVIYCYFVANDVLF